MKVIKNIHLLILAGMLSSTTLLEAKEQQLNPWLVYEIGGKAKVKQRRNRLIPLGAGVRWKTPMCGSFNMSLSISNILNGVSGQLDKLEQDLVNSITGVAANFHMILIARADPTLYEFIQQGKLDASELFNASVASCQEMSDKVINNGYGHGGKPGNWVELSGFEDWGQSDESTDDVVQVTEDVDKDKGDNGVRWVGGDKAAGKNQSPIDTVADAVKAGVNLLANRDVKSNAVLPVTDEKTPWFAKYWETPQDAADWVTVVVGETTIRTCVDCERLKTTPGKGVYSKLEEKQNQIETRILALLDAPIAVYEQVDLAEVSAPGYEITQQVMEALKNETIYRDALVGRLAEEVATADIVERLIAARRILLSGKKEAYIAQNSDAVEILNSRIKELGDEMLLIKQDADLRNSTKQSVAITLLERKRERESGVVNIVDDNTSKAIRSITGRQ